MEVIVPKSPLMHEEIAEIKDSNATFGVRLLGIVC